MLTSMDRLFASAAPARQIIHEPIVSKRVKPAFLPRRAGRRGSPLRKGHVWRASPAESEDGGDGKQTGSRFEIVKPVPRTAPLPLRITR